MMHEGVDLRRGWIAEVVGPGRAFDEGRHRKREILLEGDALFFGHIRRPPNVHPRSPFGHAQSYAADGDSNRQAGEGKVPNLPALAIRQQRHLKTYFVQSSLGLPRATRVPV
jgi:hypothetical protein